MFDYGFADELLKLAGMDWLDKEVGAHKKRQAVSQFTAPVFGAAGRALQSTGSKFPMGGGAKPNPAPPNPGQGKVTPKAMATPAKLNRGPQVSRAKVSKEQSGPLGVHRGGRMGAAQRVMERY
jgi:hypothetical protein